MKKSIRIWRNRLEISELKTESKYMVNDIGLNLFIHVDKLVLKEESSPLWLNLSCNNSHIGRLWIYTDTDRKKVKAFLEETK